MLNQVLAAVNTSVSNPLSGYTTLSQVFGAAMNVTMGVAISLAVIFLALGGIQYITSKGDAKATETARTMLTNAIIGMVIALGALAIKTIVYNTLGTDDPSVGDGILLQQGED